MLSVTEDHQFWSITDSDWVELQDLDTTDVLLTPDGATVTVDYLDWAFGAEAPAWDLTVAEEHNFFVAADASAEPVLVHNQTLGTFCGFQVPGSQAQRLFDIDMFLDQEARNALVSRLGSFEPSTRQNLFDVLTNADFADGVDIAIGAGRSASTTRFFVDDAPHLADVILRSDNFAVSYTHLTLPTKA